MMRIINIVISLMILAIPAICMEYDLHLDVGGNGHLYERTNLGLTKESINAEGKQTYNKYFADQDGRTLYVSDYNLTSPARPSKDIRMYSISANFPDGVTHFAKINSSEGILSKSWIDSTNKTTATEFQIYGVGNLIEGVTATDVRKGHNFLAETRAEGEIKMVSGLKNSVQVVYDSDLDRLKNSLETVKLSSDTGKVDLNWPKTDVSINGVLKGTIPTGQKTSVMIGNTNVEFDPNMEVSSVSEKNKKLDELKNKNTSVFEDYHGDIIAWPSVGSEENVDIRSLLNIEPEEGSIDKNVNLSIRVFNIGRTSLDRVSVAIHVPPELEYIDSSPKGIYGTGDIYWSNIGPLTPDEDGRDLIVSTVVKDLSPCSSKKLKFTGEVVGIAQDGTSVTEPIFIEFNVTHPCLSVEKYADKNEISSGEDVTYLINVRNIGTTKLEKISISEKLADGMKFIASTSGLKNTDRLITWQGGPLSPGESKTFTYVARACGEIENGEILQSSVGVTAQTAAGLLIQARNISEIRFSKRDENSTSKSNTTLICLGVPGSERLVIQSPNDPLIPIVELNFTSEPNQTVHTGDKVKFKIILEPGPKEKDQINNVSLVAEADPGLGIESRKDLTMDNGSIYWSGITLTPGNKWEDNFIATVKDTNAETDNLNVVAIVKEGQKEVNKSVVELQFELQNRIDETEGSIIASQIDEGVEERDVLVRPSRQLGQNVIWDRHLYAGWVEPRPKEIEYFTVDKSDESAANNSKKKIALIGSISKK